MIRDSVELNVPPAAVQYERNIYIHIYINTYTHTGGIIPLFYRVPGIEHAGGLDRDTPLVRCWPSEKVGVHICPESRVCSGDDGDTPAFLSARTRSRGLLDLNH